MTISCGEKLSEDTDGSLRWFWLAAVGALLVLAAPAERAQALSLSNPGAAATVQEGSQLITTEVRWHRWHRHRWYHRHWRRW